VGRVERYYWMEIDLENAEIPICVADSLRELAELQKVSPNTISENMSRAKSRGIPCKYIKIPKEKEDYTKSVQKTRHNLLSDETIRQIRERHQAGQSLRQIGRTYNVSVTTVSRAIKEKRDVEM